MVFRGLSNSGRGDAGVVESVVLLRVALSVVSSAIVPDKDFRSVRTKVDGTKDLGGNCRERFQHDKRVDG